MKSKKTSNLSSLSQLNTVPKSNKMTLSELESFLWKTSDLLRGSVDPSEYRYYIFGFMFIKRINDVFLEEREELKAQMEQEGKNQKVIEVQLEKPSRYKTSFYIPEEARWDKLKHLKNNIGEEINKMMHKIEEVPENSKLEGILTSIDFAKKELKDVNIIKILSHYDSTNLGHKNLQEPDAMGLAYEYLIKQFADQNAKDMGQFFTPRSVVKLLVELLDVQPHQKIYDPTCGTGGILLESLNSLQRKLDVEIQNTKDNQKKKELEKQKTDIALYGQESSSKTHAICRMNLMLHNIKDFSIELGDTLRDSKHIKNGSLMKFDRILANPPYSLKDWGFDDLQNDIYNRFPYGLPPKGAGDYAFVMHILKSLEEKGRAGVVLPHGILFRPGAEEKIRQGLIESDKIESVIGLAGNLFYGTSIATCILILNNNKPEDMKNKIMFINAELLFNEGKAQNILSENHINEILSVYNHKQEIKRFSKIISQEEIINNNFNLNIKKYVETSLPSEIYDIKSIINGTIPQSEIDDDHNKETLLGIDLSIFIEKKDNHYTFKITPEELEISNELNEDQLNIMKKWINKYYRSLSDINNSCKKLEENMGILLKDFGYE